MFQQMFRAFGSSEPDRPHGASATIRYLERSLRIQCEALSRPQAEGKEAPPSQFVLIAAILQTMDSMYARSGPRTWHTRPRTYAIMCRLGLLEYLDRFIDLGFTDYSLPFDWQTLGNVFGDDHKKQRFLREQGLVLTKAKRLESKQEHLHFDGDADQHFQRLRVLGKGGYGEVDEVMSKLSWRRFARKSYRRGGDNVYNRRAQQYFAEEINVLKRLSHRHLIQIVGSYTDKRHIAYLMEPVAEMNLDGFLKRYTSTDAPSLRQFFGCLASAVDYLHTERIRHRDLNPRNILVASHTVRISDFGSAFDSAGTRTSRTRDLQAPRTAGYQSPEMMKHQERNSKSDMFSLGVVFLEMLSALKGRSPSGMRLYLRQHHRRDTEPCNNMQSVHEWMDMLSTAQDSEDGDNAPLEWIRNLLEEKPANRATSESLVI
ncbi:Protein kinase [Teratosphaeria destructans]|uniref:Protein kinase n=1 Tax=Teratosphaeria destructans TaxID=418781 RepID=A0A9W7SM85_9PEZI|nr:Protein kinase [Teratosphaeria destructans]